MLETTRLLALPVLSTDDPLAVLGEHGTLESSSCPGTVAKTKILRAPITFRYFVPAFRCFLDIRASKDESGVT